MSRGQLDPESRPLQDLAWLVELGNKLAHYKSKEVTIDQITLSDFLWYEDAERAIIAVKEPESDAGGMMSVRITLPEDKIRDFCARRHIRSLALFGSVLRDDFRQDSDLDFLVDFEPDARISLFDVVTMQRELEDLFGRKVDLVELKGLRNPYRRHEILRTREVIYDGS